MLHGMLRWMHYSFDRLGPVQKQLSTVLVWLKLSSLRQHLVFELIT